MRGSEIALMRISSNIVNNNHISLNKQTSSTSPPSTCPLRTSSSSCHPSPSIGVTSNNEDSNTITISITSSGTGSAPSSSSHTAIAGDPLPTKKSGSKSRCKNPPTPSHPIIDVPKAPAKKRKKEPPKVVPPVVHQTLVCSKPSPSDPFSTYFEEEVLTDVTDESDDEHSTSFDPSLPFPSSCCTDMLDDDFDITDMRSRVLTQKLLLKRWIRVKTGSMDKEVQEVENQVKQERRMAERKRSYLDEYLDESRRRISGLDSEFKTTPLSIRKGICCFTSEDESRCSKPSIPFSRHCLGHILYNVDQMIFERCTAKDPISLTLCSNPTFDIEREEPLCDVHVKSIGDKSSEASQENTKSTPRRRARGCSSRRKKRKTQSGKGTKEIKAQVDDSGIESNQLPVPETCDSVASSESVIDDIPLQSSTSEVDTAAIPAALDVGLNLAPVDEALVASLVHELPFEPEHSEYNMMPDESFTDIFNEPLKTSNEVDHSHFVNKSCLPMTNGDSTYNYNTGHINGHGLQPPRVSGNQMMPNPEDISIIPTNILDFLTTEQQQQLNGLIDGDLSLTSPPTVKCNPQLLDYIPNGHNMYHPQQPIGCHLTNGLRHVDGSLMHQNNHHDQMLPPPTSAAFAPQYGLPPPRHTQSTLNRVVGLPTNPRFSGTSSSSIKLSTINSSMGRNQFVKITDVGSPHLNTASNAQMSNQFTKVHPVSRNVPPRNQMFDHPQQGAPPVPICPPMFEDKSSAGC